MAANEFEKNVRKEMDEFKLHPSEEVWPKIEERIREKNRKRRVLFFILFSLIALMLGGYGIYNFSGSKTRSEAQNKLSESTRPSDKKQIDNSKNEELNKETIAIKPNIPGENAQQTSKPLTTVRQRRISQPGKGDQLTTSVSKKNNISKDQAAINTSDTQKRDYSDKLDKATTGISSFSQQQVVTDTTQKEIAKPNDKNLLLNDSTGSKREELNDTRPVQVVNKKRTDKVSNKIVWGINFSAGSSVITEEAFSLKSSYAVADIQYSAPGNSQGGGSATGGGGSGGTTTYYRYAQSQNKPAFAFKAGINARKNISKRSSLSAGLGYSYLADKIKIGTTQGQNPSVFSLSYYSGSPQQTYTDHFHFIELPLSFNWRVTNNTDHFLSLNAGVSPSYLLATNAMIYDTAAGGIYYHNKDLLTNVHFNLISGIAYQFKNKKSLEFSIGPQFSFDVSKVFKNDLDKRKYFLYTGIDARVFFEKKKK
jgi:hypothetical protein